MCIEVIACNVIVVFLRHSVYASVLIQVLVGIGLVYLCTLYMKVFSSQPIFW